MDTETTLHILCKCVALAELKFYHLGKHFMEPGNYNERFQVLTAASIKFRVFWDVLHEILLCKILCFVIGINYWQNKEDGNAK
jgi:hypothetical protein